MRISVLGAGSWGTTLAALCSTHHPTILWARSAELAREIDEQHTNKAYLPGHSLPETLRASADLADVVGDADVLIVAIPSSGFRDVLQLAAPDVRSWIPIISLTKGFEQGTLLRMTGVINEVLPGRPAAVLTGPNIATEIISGHAAASVLATEDLSVARALQEVLGRGLFRVYTNHDVIGCEVAGALKNVTAIATGIAEGLGVGDNTRAAVISRGLAELTRLGVAMGGEPATFAGLAGMGDLIVTCISRHSRNRHVGEELGKGRALGAIMAEMNMVAEGINTASVAMELALRHGIEMPICAVIERVLAGELTAADVYTGLARIDAPGHESDPY